MKRSLVHALKKNRTVLGGDIEQLTAHGYRIQFHESTDTLLELIDDDEPCCVIIDVDLPGLDGAAFLTRMRAAHPQIPVIVMARRPTVDQAVRMIKLGAADFLEEPITAPHLLKSIAACTHKLKQVGS